MPRLVLYDDDGRELFDGQVSRANVELVARFLRRNMGALQAAATFKQAISSFADLFSSPPPKLPATPRRRRVPR